MLETFFSGKFKAENRAVENRFVDRLKFSLATTQEENNTSAPINLGIGLQYVLWDYSDQKTSCKAVGAIKDEGKDEAAAKGKEVATKICAVAPDATKDDLFASTSSAIGIANAYALKDGKWGNREIGTKGRWITIASGGLPVSPTSDKGAPRLQFIGHYRRFDNQPIPVDKTAAAQTSTTTATTVKKQDTATTALRLKVGQPSGAASLEFARTTKHPFGGASERTSRRAYGVEWKVGKDIWLVASAGREWNKTGVLKDQPLSFVLTSLRFGDKAFQSEDAAGKPK